MRRTGETTTSEAGGRHSKVAAVLLHEDVGGSFRRAEERMLRVIDAHRFRDARLVLVALGNLPSLRQLAERKAVRRVAVDLVRGGENKRRFRTKLARGF